MKYALLLLLAIPLSAKEKPSKLPLKPGTNIRFVSLKDGRCHIAAVMYDAKTNLYTVYCTEVKK